ncbi:hypothetical protein KL86PLE_30166 [uncultured Pleomorphomonas sp.]|uniref:Uncharacterized protein n=1 Tax=uncultured Pleomorphomonas sp. TaxID=442121 RepID=A0A212LEB6_9HYPH|nr:hypothetical protein KL86PLE_30166 [uncultured Pleomorphomonas sp.]
MRELPCFGGHRRGDQPGRRRRSLLCARSRSRPGAVGEKRGTGRRAVLTKAPPVGRIFDRRLTFSINYKYFSAAYMSHGLHATVTPASYPLPTKERALFSTRSILQGAGLCALFFWHSPPARP